MPVNDPKQLEAYRAKRSPEATPEPFGEPGAERPCQFVVQKHAARALHYDLRIEIGGVLKSWALHKPPADDPKEKRAAVATEDHPIEYADFEGLIPKGNYGAGAMIVWDRGTFSPLLDMASGLEKGKLLFELKGYKLRGAWTLVKIKKSERDWLLIKESGDGWVRGTGEAGFPDESILSGLTVEELRDGRDRAAEVRRELAALGAPQRPVDAAALEVMKAEPRERPFTRPGWIFEIKYDGFRMLAAREEGLPRLFYRSGHDATRTFPELARAVAALPYDSLVLDGEAVVLDDGGRPSFQRLQRRGMLAGRHQVEAAAVEHPATLFLFDLLAFEGYDLRPLPLAARKSVLARLLPKTGPLRYTDDLPERGEDLYEGVARLGLEGIVAKRADSPYRAGRSADWLKVRVDRVGDFAVVGWKEATSGSRSGFSGLHLAVRRGEGLVYAGSVGTGFTGRQLSEIRARLEPARRPDPPAAGPLPAGKRHVWVEPEMVVEVRYKQWTEDGSLRHPVFLRVRDDKRVAECVRQDGAGDDGPEEPSPAGLPPAAFPAPEPPAGKRVALTNLDKVFWPEEGYTKGDLVAYYRTVAPWILPYLRDRPLVLDRYPDGIAGKSFYQKNAPGTLPEWVRTVPIWGEGSSREIEYFLCDDEETLVYLANLGAIPFHVWSSRVATLARPDWSILDLDPKGAPTANVVAIAQAIRELCLEIGLEPFLKTSGGSGLHVLLPLGRQWTFEQGRQLAELLARLIVAELPAIATTERVIAARRGRVYLDFLQNGRGKLLAAPFSVRPLPGATVSTPLAWEEATPDLDIRRFTIESVPRRLRELAADPLRPVLDQEPDLAGAIARLAARLSPAE